MPLMVGSMRAEHERDRSAVLPDCCDNDPVQEDWERLYDQLSDERLHVRLVRQPDPLLHVGPEAGARLLPPLPAAGAAAARADLQGPGEHRLLPRQQHHRGAQQGQERGVDGDLLRCLVPRLH